MNFFLIFNKNYFNIFLIFYLLITIFASLSTGITHDERFDLHNFQLNQNIISNLFLNTNLNTEYLYGDKTYMNAFYGIGFHLISYPIEQIISIFNYDFNLTEEGRLQLIKHPSIIILFVLSGIYFRKLVFLLTSQKNFASLSTTFYLLYPYLLGHSFFNTKDAPFMSIWLICTFYLVDIIRKFLKSNKVHLKKVILLAFLTSILISIRIIGLLIFLEYLIFLIILLNYSSIKTKDFISLVWKPLIIFTFLVFILIYFLHPHFWNNPKAFLFALEFFKNHVQTVCTVTLGECMQAQNLPSTYLPIWFFFKLPILILAGIILFPFVEKKIFMSKINLIIIGSLVATVLSIIILLIFTKAILYDELRQVLFLVPLIMIISFITLHHFFSKKIVNVLLCSYILFFIYQNIKIFPYNYIWLNNFSTFTKVNKNFELDYWGVSTKEVSKFFKTQKLTSSTCIISNRNEAIGYYLKNNFNNCYVSFRKLDQKQTRPFYVALLERKLNKGLPNKCTEIHNENIKLNFSNENLILAKIFKCD